MVREKAAPKWIQDMTKVSQIHLPVPIRCRSLTALPTYGAVVPPATTIIFNNRNEASLWDKPSSPTQAGRNSRSLPDVQGLWLAFWQCTGPGVMLVNIHQRVWNQKQMTSEIPREACFSWKTTTTTFYIQILLFYLNVAFTPQNYVTSKW